MATVTIRQIRASEGRALRKIRLRALADTPQAFAVSLAEAVAQSDEEWTAWATVSALGESQILYVAEEDGRWIGIVGGMPGTDNSGPACALIALWVDPGYRGRGLGRALTEHIIAWAQRRAARHLELWVTEGNTAALDLYQRCGFVSGADRMPLPSHPDRVLQKMVRPL
jgi:ribosomal protein S18 acetylase RimI-like enzyme